MKKLKIFLYISIINIAILSCSNNDKELSNNVIEQSPRELYQIAMINLDQENYEGASLKFKEITFSDKDMKSLIEEGESYYRFKRILNKKEELVKVTLNKKLKLGW